MNNNQHPYDRFFTSLEPALISKVEEFEVLGYGKANVERLWALFNEKKMEKTRVTCLAVSTSQRCINGKAWKYMSFETVEAYRSPNWFAEVNEEELNNLLHPKKDTQ